MRRVLIALALGVSLVVIAPAGASTYKTTFSPSGVLEFTAPFQAFGNFKVGDCQYETAANLVLSRWPKAHIARAQVVAAYKRFGLAYQAVPAIDPTTGQPVVYTESAAQVYLVNDGFGGHRALSIVPVSSRQAVITAANAGGVEVVNMGPVRQHMFAVVKATAKTVTLIDDGYVQTFTWPNFVQSYSYGGETLTYYAVTWVG